MYFSGLRICVFLVSLSVILGCQTTNNDQSSQWDPNGAVAPSLENVASPSEIFEALTIAALEAEQPLEQAEQVEVIETDLWMHIQNQLSLTVPQNRSVISQRNWYAAHQEYLDRISDRAYPFLYFIVEEIEKRKMPIELALLPIVESAFDPFAYSHGRASGMWQFIPGTAKRFGLQHNWWYDGRRDVIESTRSALDYLSFLHKTLEGDWLNAIAAYNSGEGRILTAIKRNKRKHLPTDFWSLDLPKETAAYVPKLLALADLLKRPEEFNLVWKPIPNEPQIAIVDAKSQMDIALAAELAELEVGELHSLNPGYSQWATAPEGPFTFIVPLEKAATFKLRLAETPVEKRLNWQRYKIRSGDSLLKIAKQFNTTVPIIRAVNNIKGNMIHQGKHILIPVAAQDISKYELSEDQRLAARQSKQPAGLYQLKHTVKSGDTLWDLSREYKVSILSLAKWNSMAPKDTLHLGQTLAIWKKNTTSTANSSKNDAPSSTVPMTAAMRTITYKVRSGDSLARIAGKFSIKIKDILKWNQLNTKHYLQPGQLLKLFVDVTKV